MDADDSKYWGLFENRPAKERTSQGPSEPLPKRQPAVGSGKGWSRLQRKPQTGTGERVKC
jgi:hypothetical protein